MTRTFQRLELFVLSCLCLTFESRTSQVLPPRNVSLRWLSDFEPQLSWEKPQHSAENCTYEVQWSTSKDTSEGFSTTDPRPDLTWSEYKVLNGGYLNLSVKTFCNNTYSEPAERPIDYPELVRNLTCYIQSSKLTRCSWLPVSDAADLGFFFRLMAEDKTTSYNNKSRPPLRACPAYNDGRTGCDLQARITDAIHVLFNGTVNNKTVRNTFKFWLKSNVKPLPPNWTVVEAGDKFNISWIPPDFQSLSDWKFTITQTACNKTVPHDKSDATSIELEVVRGCENCLAIKVGKLERTKGESEWSSEKCFDRRLNALVFAAIIIPLMFAILATLTLVCCRKNKDIIFPRVPEPRDFLSDIFENNNKITVRNLHIPAEEEDCKITLVIDPQNNKLLS